MYGTGLGLVCTQNVNICRELVHKGNLAANYLCLKERPAMGDGDKTAQPTGRARGRARGRPRTAEELAAMRRPGETTTTPATSAQGGKLSKLNPGWILLDCWMMLAEVL